MVRRYYDLPLPHNACGLRGDCPNHSFKLAAAELNVTTGAISRQIRAVEDDIGAQLFTRSSTGVELTAAGMDLYAVLSQSFGRISETAQKIKLGNRASRVTLACTHAMAMMWLIPRMGSFWRANPEIFVDHLISDLSRDYRRADVELRIRYGLGTRPTKWHSFCCRRRSTRFAVHVLPKSMPAQPRMIFRICRCFSWTGLTRSGPTGTNFFAGRELRRAPFGRAA